jgi:hypothetical protein
MNFDQMNLPCRREALMKKLIRLVLLLSCSGCALLAANPGPYTYPYPDPHPCVYPFNRMIRGIIFTILIRIKYGT